MSTIVAHSGHAVLDKSSIDYEAIQDPGHGHSIAGWVAVGLILIGATVGTISNVLDSWTGFWVGGGIIVFGAILGFILQLCGLGAKPHRNHLPNT